MHVLSTDDMEFLVTSANAGKIVVDSAKLRQRIDQLIRMGYVRPNNGQFYLTELGAKTARSLQIKFYDPTEVDVHSPAVENVIPNEDEAALTHDAGEVVDAAATEATAEATTEAASEATPE